MTNPLRAKAPKHCAYCGKPAHKRLHRVWNPHQHGLEKDRPKTGSREDWKYDGNMIVVRRDVIKPGTWGSNTTEFTQSVTVWDGESWDLDYDPFCTLMCAFNFGRAAHRAGYRIKSKEVA